MNLRIPLFTKIVLPLVLLIVVAVGFSGYRTYEQSLKTWNEEMDKRASEVAGMLAKAVDPDLLAAIEVPEDVDTRAYQQIKKDLQFAQQAGNLTWVGIYRVEGDYLYYWVDTSDSGIGYPFFYATYGHRAAVHDMRAYAVRYTDEFGSYRGYVAPITARDADGSSRVVGLVEAVIGMESYQMLQQSILKSFLPTITGGILISIGVAVLLALLLFDNPLQKLKWGALALAGGELGHMIDLHSRDELADLAETFNLMSARLAHVYGELQTVNRQLEARVAERTVELREERNRLDTILQNIADGLVVTDPEGRIVLVNPAFVQSVGLGWEAVNGRPLSEVFPSEQLTALVKQAFQRPGEVYTANLPPLRINMQNLERVYKISSSALVQRCLPDGQELPQTVQGVVTVIRDITRETEVDRMKTEFISTVSHELRTPLTSVLGFTKLISKSFDRDVVPAIPAEPARSRLAMRRIQDNLSIIINEAERLTRLINDVLDIAKMEAGKVEWHFGDIPMAGVVECAVTAISSQAETKGLPITVDLEPNLPPVWADRDRVIQVVTNLLSNAVKFSDEGGLTVQARRITVSEDGAIVPAVAGAESRLTSGTWITVSVTDQGMGIPQDSLAEVFQKFKQLGDMMTNRPKGTGLGLAICKEIIEHHQGHIWAVSTLGVGSTFTFALPLMTAAAGQPPVGIEELRRRIAETLPDVQEGKRVLVVDDEESIRTLLHQELSSAGYRVMEASNGLEALERARDQHPDLIILDLMMPGINGFDVLSVLKGDVKTSPIPVLILSVLEDREQGLRLGADEYLIKPLDTERLLRTIAGLLDRASRGEGRKKVLVIDEDVRVIDAIRRVLQERGYEVVEANDGKSGLERARMERPDLIILDSVISKMDDYSVLKALKSDAHAQEALVIVLTATATPEEVAALLEGRGHSRLERLGDLGVGAESATL